MKKIPLLQALEQLIKKNPLSLHVPGHKNGKHTFINEDKHQQHTNLIPGG